MALHPETCYNNILIMRILNKCDTSHISGKKLLEYCDSQNDLNIFIEKGEKLGILQKTTNCLLVERSYKTAVCKYYNKGCSYGLDCHFIHGFIEKQVHESLSNNTENFNSVKKNLDTFIYEHLSMFITAFSAKYPIQPPDLRDDLWFQILLINIKTYMDYVYFPLLVDKYKIKKNDIRSIKIIQLENFITGLKSRLTSIMQNKLSSSEEKSEKSFAKINLQHENQKLKEQFDDLEKNNHNLKKKVDDLKKKVDDLKKNNHDLEGKIHKSKGCIVKSRNKTKKQKSELNEQRKNKLKISNIGEMFGDSIPFHMKLRLSQKSIPFHMKLRSFN